MDETKVDKKDREYRAYPLIPFAPLQNRPEPSRNMRSYRQSEHRTESGFVLIAAVGAVAMGCGGGGAAAGAGGGEDASVGGVTCEVARASRLPLLSVTFTTNCMVPCAFAPTGIDSVIMQLSAFAFSG